MKRDPNLRLLQLAGLSVIGIILLTLLIFQLFFWITLAISPQLYARTVSFGQGLILFWLRLFGVKFVVSGPTNECSAVYVSNHQSFLDIALISWYLRASQPRFIAKRELGRWIPSVSHALRHLGSALIDRRSALHSLREIQNLGERAAAEKFAVVIFPEGSRSSDGRLRPFKTAGVKTLLEKLPNRPIIPIAISGSAELLNNRPRIPRGTVRLAVGAPVPADISSVHEILHWCWKEIDRLMREAGGPPGAK